MREYPWFDFDQVDFITAATHFSHARISELAGRPFTTVEEMNKELIRRWNDTVGPDDDRWRESLQRLTDHRFDGASAPRRPRRPPPSPPPPASSRRRTSTRRCADGANSPIDSSHRCRSR